MKKGGKGNGEMEESLEQFNNVIFMISNVNVYMHPYKLLFKNKNTEWKLAQIFIKIFL